eukprot:scaffold212330_cov19-Tisochrysis_lutea.AAC.1
MAHTLNHSIPYVHEGLPLQLRNPVRATLIAPPSLDAMCPSCLHRFLDQPVCPSGHPLASPTAAVFCCCCCSPSAVAGTADVLARTARGSAAGAGAAAESADACAAAPAPDAEPAAAAPAGQGQVGHFPKALSGSLLHPLKALSKFWLHGVLPRYFHVANWLHRVPRGALPGVPVSYRKTPFV